MSDPRPRARILVVDDEEAIRDLLQEVLAGEGYEVATAGDGPHAVRVWWASEPDLVLLDLRLPGMDGVAVIEEIRRRDPHHAPVVIVSAATTAPDTARRAGCDAFLAKPFTVEQVISTVARLVEPGGRRPSPSP